MQSWLTLKVNQCNSPYQHSKERKKSYQEMQKKSSDKIQPLFIINWGFPDSSVGKESTCNAGDLDSIPALGRSPGEGKGYPLQYSGMENSMGCTVHGVSRSWTRLSNFQLLTYLFIIKRKT